MEYQWIAQFHGHRSGVSGLMIVNSVSSSCHGFENTTLAWTIHPKPMHTPSHAIDGDARHHTKDVLMKKHMNTAFST
jgi:hypothetical protein